jgi:hypothetical protein
MDEFLDIPTYWANMDLVLFLEQLKNLSGLLQDMMSHIATIKAQLNTEKAWWEVFLLPSLPPFLGAASGAGLAFLGNNKLFLKRNKTEEDVREKEKEKTRFGKICAALASFEDTRITLLTFKKDFLEKYKKDMEIYILLENYYKSKNNQTKKDILEKWPSLISPFEFFPLQSVDNRNFAEELSFLATTRGPYLIALQKLHGELLAINDQIKVRNDFMSMHIEKSIYDNAVGIKQICVAIDLHHSSCHNLNNIVDSALAFTQLAVKYLNEYTEKYLPKEKLPTIKLETDKEYEKLMPSENYHEGFDQRIQQAINASK